MSLVTTDANAASDAVNATEFGRPEDVQVINNVLYVALTTEDRVVALDLRRRELTSFVQAGGNVPVENEEAKVTGFNGPDNLAKGPTASCGSLRTTLRVTSGWPAATGTATA